MTAANIFKLDRPFGGNKQEKLGKRQIGWLKFEGARKHGETKPVPEETESLSWHEAKPKNNKSIDKYSYLKLQDIGVFFLNKLSEWLNEARCSFVLFLILSCQNFKSAEQEREGTALRMLELLKPKQHKPSASLT